MKLFKHQNAALARAREGNLALFHDCGTGKTVTALNLIRHWKAKGEGPALVVCPLSIIEAAWKEDCKRFIPELSIVSLWAKDPHTRYKRLAQDKDIYVCNFETFKSLYPAICKKDFKVLIIDESSKMKNPKSQITQAILSLAGIPFRRSKYKTTNKPVPHRYVLSGTPAPNDESEYWAQIKMITGPGNGCFHDNYYAFRSKYFTSIPLGLTGQKMFKFHRAMQGEFMEAMRPVTHIVSKEDALDLPEQTHLVRKVFLSKEERKAYDTMKNDLVLRFKDEMVLSQTALTEAMKLRQLTSGFVYGENETYRIGKSKFTELDGLLEEIGDHQVIIWANFREEIQILHKRLNAKFNKDRDEVIKNFKEGDTKYLIANPASAAHGLTFTNCRYAVYFSLNYSYELQKQSQDRIHRIGQEHSTTYYYLLADKTVDEMIYKTLQRKGDISKLVLDYLKKGK
jgi:SNF2 family DNA or RNA helicase